jgi:hypothetical protein
VRPFGAPARARAWKRAAAAWRAFAENRGSWGEACHEEAAARALELMANKHGASVETTGPELVGGVLSRVYNPRPSGRTLEGPPTQCRGAGEWCVEHGSAIAAGSMLCEWALRVTCGHRDGPGAARDSRRAFVSAWQADDDPRGRT